jgi:methenyltetrahydrofolate cyclohydrolase
MLTSLSVTDFLDEIASNSPAPGGGSVSALAASLGAALSSMVCRLTIGKKNYSDVQQELDQVLKQTEMMRTQFLAMIEEDTEAFNQVIAAYGLPKGTEEQKTRRSEAIQQAMKTATLIPLKLMERCTKALELVQRVVEKGNKNSLSDTCVAALMLQAGCEGAAMNVKINLGSIHDAEFVEQTTTKLNRYRNAQTSTSTGIAAYAKKQLG